MKATRAINVLLSLFFLTGCCYQFGRGELSDTYSTFSLPIIAGDQTGELTSEVIKRISLTGALRYKEKGGDIQVRVVLLNMEEEDIDFTYDRKRSGRRKKSLIPTETRVNATAEVSLVEAASGRILRGPVTLTAQAEFDHTYYATRNDVNIFSQGQLGDIDAAREAAIHPLNCSLAASIASWVVNG